MSGTSSIFPFILEIYTLFYIFWKILAFTRLNNKPCKCRVRQDPWMGRAVHPDFTKYIYITTEAEFLYQKLLSRCNENLINTSWIHLSIYIPGSFICTVQRYKTGYFTLCLQGKFLWSNLQIIWTVNDLNYFYISF